MLAVVLTPGRCRTAIQDQNQHAFAEGTDTLVEPLLSFLRRPSEE